MRDVVVKLVAQSTIGVHYFERPLQLGGRHPPRGAASLENRPYRRGEVLALQEGLSLLFRQLVLSRRRAGQGEPLCLEPLSQMVDPVEVCSLDGAAGQTLRLMSQGRSADVFKSQKSLCQP